MRFFNFILIVSITLAWQSLEQFASHLDHKSRAMDTAKASPETQHLGSTCARTKTSGIGEVIVSEWWRKRPATDWIKLRDASNSDGGKIEL